MDALATIVGLGLASFLLFFFSSQLEEKHGLLKLLSLFFVLSLVILIPKALIDNQETCYSEINTSTTVGNTTTYTYLDYCVTDSNNTDATFYTAILWFYRLFMAYVILYLGWEALQALMNSFRNRGRRN